MEKENDVNVAINGSKNREDGDQEADPMEGMDEQSAAKERLTSSETIKFTPINMIDGKNGDAKVDIHLVQTSIGMGKEELMKYANEPFWIRLRLFLFVLFWVGWIAMLVGAVVIILLAPRCPPAPVLEWYQKDPIYEVDVGAYKDSDGDGVGDFKGLTANLEHISSINVKTLLLSAFYAMAPAGDGIVNHTMVDPRFGTMTDFDEFIAESKEKGIKVIIDFNPNHSSDEHLWFRSSRQGLEPYDKFYVWRPHDGTDDPPNNWLSVEGGSAWEKYEDTHQYYLHTYGKDKPDLNLRNDDVKEELTNILRFWLDKGVNGVRIVAASHLVEDEGLRDEPLLSDKRIANPTYDDVNHVYTVDQPENYVLLAEWRDILNNRSAETEHKKIMLADLTGSINGTLRYYGNESHPLVDLPINTELTKFTESSNATELQGYLQFWTDVIPPYGWPNWMLGSKDTARLASRVGPDLIDGMYMITVLARGTPIFYFGDEIGMKEPAVSTAAASNMLHTNVTKTNLTENQVDDQNSGTEPENPHLKVFKHLLSLRNQPAINFGIQEYPVVTDTIFSMIRARKGSPAYLVVVNMGDESTTIDFSKAGNKYLPESARVDVKSSNIVDGNLAAANHPKIQLNKVQLGPKQSVVFSFVAKFED